MPDDAAFHLARLQARFALLDVTGDGHLRAEDFDLLAERVLNALGMELDSDKARALFDGCRTYWRGLAATSGGAQEDLVTFEEYAAAALDADHFDVYGQPYARALAALADRDDDGYIESADFLACMTAIGFPLSRVKQLFSTLSYKDRITTGAWQAAIKDYYVNTSGDTPGQLLTRRSV
ncbi:EF-hand domain-containing protein [Nonomuraea zeae]|uniref:EF-hand domain-containing protein n=1 Tax=Nonomuraea zeae TaxID=1642303 RepID=A0A5S4FSN0_9ACTN|nr:EF-hand domain-containing protein [Nonomuraea zeae]TMR23622.1 EF-hand domain-containing protein [Nonomuraea zeae]